MRSARSWRRKVPFALPHSETSSISRLLAVAFTNPEGSLIAQLTGIGVIFAWVFGTSIVTWGIIKAVMGIRVSEEEELEGVDISECGLEAYPEFTTK